MITGNEPAYATSSSFDLNGDSRGNGNDGLTIRQHFAAMAMSSIASQWVSGGDSHADIIAKSSVEIADALIAELNKTPNP